MCKIYGDSILQLSSLHYELIETMTDWFNNQYPDKFEVCRIGKYVCISDLFEKWCTTEEKYSEAVDEFLCGLLEENDRVDLSELVKWYEEFRIVCPCLYSNNPDRWLDNDDWEFVPEETKKEILRWFELGI